MRLYAVRSLSLQTSARIIVRVMCRCSFPRKGPWRKRADSSRRAGEERASSPPSQAAPDRDELPAHPIPSPGQKSQGGSRQLFRDVTALLPRLQRPSWSRPTAPGTHNPIFNPCIAWRSPFGALGPWSPSSLGFYHLGSLLRSIPPSIQPASQASIVTPRRIGTGQTGRDRARWSGPCPVSDHAPVRKR